MTAFMHRISDLSAQCRGYNLTNISLILINDGVVDPAIERNNCNCFDLAQFKPQPLFRYRLEAMRLAPDAFKARFKVWDL